MEIVCLDMEGTLTPEIWEKIATNTGIEDFNKTTRDIPDYSELMDFRLKVMDREGLTLSDIQEASSALDLLPGAEDFLNRIREDFQVVILSDTFHEIAKPLMKKMGFPLLLCHNLEVVDNKVISYKLRHQKAKKQAIQSFQSIGYKCIAAGDSYNDLQMFEVADHGFFINAPDKISSAYPEIPSFNNYSDLESAIKERSLYLK